mmetsp:Transcript_18396/g.31455  ORF Transcript_18396/g.31455 Transcript_18396/m.31455 type:complete len:97 (+) Transcript_18396:493-783(+)
MELETDFLSCQLAGSVPKSDQKDPLKIKNKDKLSDVVRQLFLCLTYPESRQINLGQDIKFSIGIDELNCFSFSLESTQHHVEMKKTSDFCELLFLN